MCIQLGQSQSVVYTLSTSTLIKSDTLLSDSIIVNKIKKNKKNSSTNFNEKVDYQSADSIVTLVNEERIILKNKAKVVFGDVELTAAYIVIDFKRNEILAHGKKDSLGNLYDFPIFKDGDQTFESEEIRYNFKTEKGIITNVISEQDGGFLHGKRTKKHSDDIIDLKAGKYTTCNHEHPHYYIAMTKARVIKDDKIVSGPLYLVIGDIPTPLAIPFGFFPFTREKTSGLILPSYGDSETRGFSLERLGYYWAINDYFDLKITGSVYSKGSLKGSISSRYKRRYRYSGNIALSLEKIVEGEKGLSDEVNTKAYSFIWTHKQDAKAHPNSNFYANVNLKNSATNIYSNSIEQHLTNTVNSTINYSNNLAGTPFSLNAQLRHVLDTRKKMVTMTLPSININMKKLTPFESFKFTKRPNIINKIGITYRSEFKNQFKVHEDKLFQKDILDEFRYGIKHNVNVSSTAKFLKHFNFSPTANYTERWYFNSIKKQQDNSIFIESDTVLTHGKLSIDTISGFNRVYDYSMGASINTTLYGFFKFQSYIPIETIRIVHTPSVGYRYKPNFTTDKYGYFGTIYGDEKGRTYSYYENGIYGYPNGGKSGAITFSLNNQIGMKVRTPKDSINSTKKIDLLKQLNFSTNYNIAADSLNWAPLNMNASTSLFNKINISGNATLDPYALHPTNYNRENKFQFKENGKLGRITYASFDVSFGIDSKFFQNEDNKNKKENPSEYYDYFNIPWSFNISYKYSYMKPKNIKTQRQTVVVRGDFSVTPKWKVGVTSRYDLESKKIATMEFNVVRDLHCWVASFRWIPFGIRQSYSFTIGVKASILQDLKWDKKDYWYDANN